MIDNVVGTDSWVSIAGASCGLTDVGAGEEQARKVVASEATMCGEDKYDGFLVEPQNQGRTGTTWEPRLHQVRGVSGGSSEKHCVPWLIHKAKTKEPKMEVQQHRTGLTGGSDRSDR
jgi:hypothetical protein